MSLNINFTRTQPLLNVFNFELFLNAVTFKFRLLRIHSVSEITNLIYYRSLVHLIIMHLKNFIKLENIVLL